MIETPQSTETGQSFRTSEYSADDMQVLARQENEASQDWEDSWDEDTGSNQVSLRSLVNETYYLSI